MMKMLVVLFLGLTAQAQAASSYLGTEDQLVHGNVGVSSGTNTLGIGADGSISVNLINVATSTQAIRGADGSVVTTTVEGATVALNVNNIGRANLFGLSLVYRSSDSMSVGIPLTLTGLANSVELQAFTNDCTFDIDGGDSINVFKNTSQSFAFDYTAVDLTVNLLAKSAGAICRARITGAN